MKVSVINIGSNDIKQSSLNLYNGANGSNVKLNLADFLYFPCKDGLLGLTRLSKRGFVHNKINIKDLFPSDIDLKPFTKFIPGQQIKTMRPEHVSKTNTQVGFTYTGEIDNLFKNSSNANDTLANMYLLFCRLTGFFEIDASDVILTSSGNKMNINVVESNIYYTGSLEVGI